MAVARPQMLSVPHLIIIFIVALVVFGPEKLPELARNFGKVMAEFKRATGDLRSTFEEHLREIERESDQRRIGGATLASASPAAVAATPVSTVPAELNAAEPMPGVVAARPPYEPPDLPSYDDPESYMYKPGAPYPGEEDLDLNLNAENVEGAEAVSNEAIAAPEPEPEPEKVHMRPGSESPTEAVSSDGGHRPD